MRWALVLGGGGARGLAHIGLISVIERRGFPKPAFVAGASMGAIIGAMYASGWNARRLEDYALGFKLGDYLDNPAFRLPDFALSRAVQAGSAIAALAAGKAVDSGRRAEAEFERLFGGARIEDLSIPFACAACDLASGKPVVLESGRVSRALRASMSFPGVFQPVPDGGALLVDGGVLDNLPCDLAAARAYTTIIASDVSPFSYEAPARLSNPLALLYRCFDVAAEAASRPSSSKASLTIVSSDGRQPFDFDDIPAIIELGRANAEAKADELERALGGGPSPARALFAKLWPWKRSTRR